LSRPSSRVSLAIRLAVSILLLLPAYPLGAAEKCPACSEFNDLNSDIRDNRIGRTEALKEMMRLVPLLKGQYAASGGRVYRRSEWRFPLEGYDIKSSGNKGRDYVASGYDFFDGNRHGGHPSLDLFIRDRNSDSLDDSSRAPVNVLSITGGIVVALAGEWDTRSRLRGGKYLWVYDPSEDLLVYYAHNRDILVGLGDILKPGDPVATVGRTGLNAWKKRSPTHLHLTCLKLQDGYPKPENIYRHLKSAVIK